LFGTLIGALICYMKMSKNKVLAATAEAYITLLRGLPVLVLLMIIYYVVFASVNINPVIVSVIAFGLNFGAYVSEMFRTSIQGIDKGQKEAAIAGGFTNFQAFRFIILPQALKSILPVYKGEFISMVKMTSIVGYIAVQDLTKASDIIRSRTFDAFFPLFMTALLYFIIAYLLTRLLDLIEVSADPRKKSRNRRKEVKQ
jgi:polar amino acid transport system substrate-binding protein